MQYTNDQIIAALEESNGRIQQAAKILGCSRWVITSRAKSTEAIRALLTQRGSGGKGRQQFSDEDIVRAIELSNGMLSVAARKLGCSRRTMEMRVKESESVRSALEEERERALDAAEAELAKAVRAGKAWAIIFTLSTLGKKRGYTKQQLLDMDHHIIIDLPESFTWIEPEE